MKLNTSGTALDLPEAVVARIAVTPSATPVDRSDLALLVRERSGGDKDLSGYGLLLSELSDVELGAPRAAPRVVRLRNTDHLFEGDIVFVSPRGGEVRTLYRPASPHNVIFTTDRCNSNCLMCSQPPKDRDDSWRVWQIREMIRLIEKPPAQLGITGGEPTLLGPTLSGILPLLRDRLPETRIHMLTNGRRFADRDFAREFTAAAHPHLTLGIPLYSDHAQDHDYVVQAEGAFDQTVLGLHQLARYRQRVEIRVVVHLQTASRLPAIAEYIWRHFPFASHVALMGLEPMGYTKRNRDLLWIDPNDYREELRAAVRALALRGMAVSVYNHQLCTVERSVWPFCRQAISDWKNVYLPACDDCAVRETCGGFFASAERFHSAHIRPVPAS